MITGNEPYNRHRVLIEDMRDALGNEIYCMEGGLSISQELSARFMQSIISHDPSFSFDKASEDACNAADALINEWNKREQSKPK